MWDIMSLRALNEEASRASRPAEDEFAYALLKMLQKRGFVVEITVLASSSSLGVLQPEISFKAVQGKIVPPGIRCDNPGVQEEVARVCEGLGGKITPKRP